MSCEHCIGTDGVSSFPVYGIGPHTCFYKIPGAKIGESVALPKKQWPENFTEDPDSPGLGIYSCPHCGEGKPWSPPSPAAAQTNAKAPSDADILSMLEERHGSIVPTYYIKNMLRGRFPGLKTPFVLRRMKALETSGRVRRVNHGYATMHCWSLSEVEMEIRRAAAADEASGIVRTRRTKVDGTSLAADMHKQAGIENAH